MDDFSFLDPEILKVKLLKELISVLNFNSLPSYFSVVVEESDVVAQQCAVGVAVETVPFGDEEQSHPRAN